MQARRGPKEREEREAEAAAEAEPEPGQARAAAPLASSSSSYGSKDPQAAHGCWWCACAPAARSFSVWRTRRHDWRWYLKRRTSSLVLAAALSAPLRVGQGALPACACAPRVCSYLHQYTPAEAGRKRRGIAAVKLILYTLVELEAFATVAVILAGFVYGLIPPANALKGVYLLLSLLGCSSGLVARFLWAPLGMFAAIRLVLQYVFQFQLLEHAFPVEGWTAQTHPLAVTSSGWDCSVLRRAPSSLDPF